MRIFTIMIALLYLAQAYADDSVVAPRPDVAPGQQVPDQKFRRVKELLAVSCEMQFAANRAEYWIELGLERRGDTVARGVIQMVVNSCVEKSLKALGESASPQK